MMACAGAVVPTPSHMLHCRMDSPTGSAAGGGRLLHSLNAVVNFLHSEGFYAAGGAIVLYHHVMTSC
jgi:hypothetical protein